MTMKRKLMMVAVAGALGVVSLATASFSVAGTLGASVLTDNGKALTGHVIAAPVSLQQALAQSSAARTAPGDSAVAAVTYTFGQNPHAANTGLSGTGASITVANGLGTMYAQAYTTNLGATHK